MWSREVHRYKGLSIIISGEKESADADHCILTENGKIIASGTSDEVDYAYYKRVGEMLGQDLMPQRLKYLYAKENKL